MTDATKCLSNFVHDVRPWGEFKQFTLNELSTEKVITVRAGQSLSLQSHELRDEFWFVLAGSGTFRVGDQEDAVQMGNSVFIPRRTKHRATAGPDGLTFLEVAFGEFYENDIERFEDKYGRA